MTLTWHGSTFPGGRWTEVGGCKIAYLPITGLYVVSRLRSDGLPDITPNGWVGAFDTLDAALDAIAADRVTRPTVVA